MADVLNLETDDSLLLEDGSSMLELEGLGWTGNVSGVDSTDISKIMGVAIADIAKVGGV